MAIQYRPLGLVKEMLEQLGIEVTYAYEDLVFIEHNHFLLQFGKKGEILFFHTNVETSENEGHRLFVIVQTAANQQGLTLLRRDRYQMTAGDGENLSLQFLQHSTHGQE